MLRYQALEVKRYVGALEALQLQQTFACKIKVKHYFITLAILNSMEALLDKKREGRLLSACKKLKEL